MGHIFISYSHNDKDYVEKLEKKLIDEGFDVWVDHRIDYGSQWPKEIQKALDACDAFVVVVSENAYESEWVQHEVARAKRKKKPFFPLLYQGDAWLAIESTQYVDVRNGSLPPKRFYRKLKSKLPESSAVQKAYVLLQNSMQSWFELDVLPSADALFVLWRDLDHKLLSEVEMAFLYCAYYLQSSMTEEWIDENEFFSFDGYLDRFVQRQNFFSPILETFPFDRFAQFGMGNILENDGVVVSSKIFLPTNQENDAPAIYFLIRAYQSECLEILLFREDRVKALVSHSRTDAQAVSDIFFAQIDKASGKASC